MSSANAAQSVVPACRHRLVLIALALISVAEGAGCATWRMSMLNRQSDPMAGAPHLSNSKNPPLQELVAHLNQNTERIQSWRADNVRIQTNGWTLTGKLAVEKENHVRLIVSSPMGNEVDLGSNDERFWVWSRRMEPAFVTCRHENIEQARQKMGIPFEPNWLMQTLGVAPLPVSGVKLEAAPNHEQARLVEELVSIHGYPLRRVLLVDLKRGIVVEHSLYDHNATRIALAKLSGHTHDKASGIVMPHRVLLEWPQNQISMTMDLGKIQINPKSIPSQVWQMPEMPRYQVVNLDDDVGHSRVATRNASSVQFGEIESVSADGSKDDKEDSEEKENEWDSDKSRRVDVSGHTRFSEGAGSVSSSRSRDDDWYK